MSLFAVLALVAALYIPLSAAADGDVEITGITLSPSAFGAAYSPSPSTDLIVQGYVDTGESPPSGRQVRVTLRNVVNDYKPGGYFSTDLSRVSLPSFLESPAVLVDGPDVTVTMDVKQITGNATGSFTIVFPYDAEFRGWVADGETMADVTVASMDVTDPDEPVTLSAKHDSVTAQFSTYGRAEIDKADGNAAIVPPDSVRALDLRLSGTGFNGASYEMNRYFVPGTEFEAVLTFPVGAVVTGYGSGVLDAAAGTVTWTLPVNADGLPAGHTVSYLWSDSNVKISFPEAFLNQAVSLSLTGYGRLVGDDASSAYVTKSLSFPVKRAIHMAPVVFRGFANCNVLIDEPETESQSYDGVSELRNAGTEPVPDVKVTYYNDADGAGRKGRVSRIAFTRSTVAYKIKILTYIYKYDGSAAGVPRREMTTYADQPAGNGVSVNVEANASLGAGEYIDRIELYPLTAASTPGCETNELPVGVNFGVGVYYKSWGKDGVPASWVFPSGATILPDSYTASRFTASWADDYSPPAGATVDGGGVCTAARGPSNSVRYNWNAYNPIGIFTLATTGAKAPGDVLTGSITFGNGSRLSTTYGSADWVNPEMYFIPPSNVEFDPSQTLYVTGHPEPIEILPVKTVNDRLVYRLRLPAMALPPNGLVKTIGGVSMTIKPGAARAVDQQVVHPSEPYAAGNGGLLLTSRDATEVSGRFTQPSTVYGYSASDAYDLDDNAYTARMLSAANSGVFTVRETTEMLAYATLKNNETGDWKPAQDQDAETTVALYGTGQYRLTVQNKGNTWMGEVRLLDILPKEGDVQVLSPYDPRGSEWRATLQSVRLQMFDANHEEVPGHQMPQIRYSAQSDPDYSFNGGVQRSGRPDGEFVGGATLAETRSFELTLPERIPPGYSAEILITVKAPFAGTTGKVAYNSFVATANFYETSVSQTVKTATTFEPSKQKFVLYAANISVPSGGGIGGGGNGNGGNGNGGNGNGGNGDGGNGNGGDVIIVGAGSGGNIVENVVEDVVRIVDGENGVAEPGDGDSGGDGGGTVDSGKRKGSGKAGAKVKSSSKEPATTSPAVTSPMAVSAALEELDSDIIDERTFSKESIEQFKTKGSGMSTRYKGLTMDDEVLLVAQTGNAFADLKDGNVPVGNFEAKSVWSLLSLILSLVAVVLSVLLIVGALFRRRRGDSGEYALGSYAEYAEYPGYGVSAAAGRDEKRRKGGRMLGMLAVAFGALTLIIWRILDDLSQPMAWMNEKTPIIVILFAIHITCLVIYLVRRAGRDRASGYVVSTGWTKNNPSSR